MGWVGLGSFFIKNLSTVWCFLFIHVIECHRIGEMRRGRAIHAKNCMCCLSSFCFRWVQTRERAGSDCEGESSMEKVGCSS